MIEQAAVDMARPTWRRSDPGALRLSECGRLCAGSAPKVQQRKKDTVAPLGVPLLQQD
jgi:hypothetical protein